MQNMVDPSAYAHDTAAPALGFSRRGLLSTAGAVLGAGAIGPLSGLSTRTAAAQPAAGTPGLAELPTVSQGTALDQHLRRHTLEVRVRLAQANAAAPAPPHPDNGDEARYANKLGSDTRGLPHDQRGEVDPAAWRTAVAAYESGDPAEFEKIPLGGTRKQANPLASLAVNLIGLDPTQFAIPVPATLASAARAAEAVELYWKSLLRDVPFTAYRDDTGNRDVIAAVDELNRLADFQGPKADGRVTPQTLFRGSAFYVDRSDPSGRTGRWAVPPGALEGPMVSQFLYRDTPYSSQFIPARMRTSKPESEFLTDYAEWLRVQNGAAPSGRVQYDPVLRYIANGRDLGQYTHVTPPAAAWAAAIQLAMPSSEAEPRYGGMFPAARPAFAPANPYPRSRTQAGGSGSFGLPYVHSLIGLAISRATRFSVWQKYWVHRTLRPEAYGGLVHLRLAGGAQDYPLHDSILGSQALERSRAKQGTHLLAHIYPEGSPMHPAYPGSAAINAATCVTLLKAFYDETREIPNPVQPDPNDPERLVPYTGPALTVGGELNKLALNYGSSRAWAGIHWRSDAAASLPLGEDLAISMLREEKATLREPFDGFSFTRFDGTRVTI
jgi:hypothetical protein